MLFSLSVSEETVRADVLQLAVARTKQECLKAGKPAQICDTLTGSGGNADDCGGHTCWIAYVYSKNPYDYNADMYITRDSYGHYVISDFRSGISRPPVNK